MAAKKAAPMAVVRSTPTIPSAASGFAGGSTFSFGDSPVWHYRSFNDLFLHPYLGNGLEPDELKGPLSNGGLEGSMEALSEILRLVSSGIAHMDR